MDIACDPRRGRIVEGAGEDPWLGAAVAARDVLTDPDHRIAAREAAQRTAVLLRNEGDLLPLEAGGAIAVLGPLAGSARDTVGLIPAGATRRVSFPVGPVEGRYWRTTDRDWVLDESTFDIDVGGAGAAGLTRTFAVTHAGR